MPDTLTFLGSASILGAKTFTPAGAVDYSIGEGPFETRRVSVESLNDLALVLAHVPRNAFHVRGAPTADVIPYRRHISRAGAPASLVSEPHEILPIDIDAPCEHGKTCTDPACALAGTDLIARATEHRDLLPMPFRAARCLAVATSSAGVKTGARVRLWFHLSRPITDAEAKAWLNGSADTSVYTPSQPIYCAAPTFVSVPDPFATRSRVVALDGVPRVEVPGSFDIAEPVPLDGFGSHVAAPQIGTRNTTLTAMAGAMRRKGFAVDAIAGALRSHNASFAEPLPTDEVDRIAVSIGNYEPEAIPAPAAPRSGKAATKAIKRAAERLENDPALLPEVASILAGHVRSGACSEGEAITAMMRGLDACATAHKYTRDDITKVLSAAPPVTPSVPHWAADCILNEDGQPLACPENLRIVLQTHPDFSLWWNERAQADFWSRCPWHPPGPVLPTDDFALRAWISRELGWHKCPAEPLAAIAEVARANPWDPWRAFLDSLQWDGVRRIDTAAVRLLGCDDTEVNRTTFAWWLISAVARSMQPGCQVDHVIVLEGEQQLGKTSFLRGLAMHDAFFTRLVSGADLNAPRTIAKIHGPVIIEMAELAVMRRAEVETIKAFLDERTDRVQWLYSRKPVDVPRSCVFAASTNDSHYLRDTTGNRRFWPIRCRSIDLVALEAEREMLWAEAVALYRAGAKWWPTREESVSLGIVAAQEERLEVEPVGDVIGEVLARVLVPGKHPLTGATIDAADLDASGRLVRGSLRMFAELAGLHAVRDGNAITRALRLLRWTPLRIPGSTSRVWIAPDAKTRGTYEVRTCPQTN